jgi:hypothetical protein
MEFISTNNFSRTEEVTRIQSTAKLGLSSDEEISAGDALDNVDLWLAVLSLTFFAEFRLPEPSPHIMS